MGGGGFSTLRGAGRTRAQTFLRRILPQSKARRVTGNLIHPLELLKRFGQPFEEAARVGEFIRAKGQQASTMEAILAQQEVTINFLQGGGSASMQGLAHATAFLNPALQALDRFARIGALPVTRARQALAVGAGKGEAAAIAGKTAARVLLTATATVSLPSLYFWVAARDDQEIQDLRKTNAGLIYWFVRGPQGEINKIPKPFLWGQIFGTGMEAMLDKFADDDPEAAKRFVKGVKDQTLSNVLPNVIGIYVAQESNRTRFFGTPIVPKGLEGVEPRFQVQNHTGAIARRIGDRFNISPARLEAVYRDVTGSLGVEVLRAADRIVDRVDGRAAVPERVGADRAIIGRIFARNPSFNVEPIRTFYDGSSKTIEAVESFRVNQNNPAALMGVLRRRQADIMLAPLYETTRADFAESRNVLETLRGLPDDVMSARRKRELINRIMRQMIEKARTINKVARLARKNTHSDKPKDNKPLRISALIRGFTAEPQATQPAAAMRMPGLLSATLPGPIGGLLQ